MVVARHARAEQKGMAAVFEEQRPHLVSVAYRMLGSVTEAEDVVQDAWLRLQQASHDEIRSLRAYLVTVVSRLCLDQLKSARARREVYTGPWLPEPVATSLGDPGPAVEENLIMRESLSLAFLTLLETLNPLERAVFLLHEVFDYSYPETAEIVGKSEPACRQAFSRAKKSLVAGRPRFPTSYAEQQRLTNEFLRAAEAGDMDGLTAMLAEDVTIWTDGGGKVQAALQPIVGRDKVLRFIEGPAGRFLAETMRVAEVNGEVALVAQHPSGGPTVIVPEWREGVLVAVRAVANPDKLAHLHDAQADALAGGPGGHN
jgi:RNA polymerase sigma-70 factor (ECF subfamily)